MMSESGAVNTVSDVSAAAGGMMPPVDTRNMKYQARVNHKCPAAISNKSHNLKSIMKYYEKRSEKRDRD